MSHKKRKSPEPTPEAKDEIPTDILAEWKQLFPDIDASELERAAEKARKRLEFKASIPGASHSSKARAYRAELRSMHIDAHLTRSEQHLARLERTQEWMKTHLFPEFVKSCKELTQQVREVMALLPPDTKTELVKRIQEICDQTIERAEATVEKCLGMGRSPPAVKTEERKD